MRLKNPAETLASILVTAEQINNGCSMETHEDMYEWYQYRADKLAGLVVQLDEHLRAGGILPAQWLITLQEEKNS